MKKIVISSGHGKYVRGAKGYIDEVDEARKVVEQVAKYLRQLGIETTVYHDDTSKNVNDNLNRIVSYHNGKQRELDISIHFNAHKTTSSAMGVEVLYFDQKNLANAISNEIATQSGLKNRGGKERKELYFLRNTNKPALLIEVCFVDSKADIEIYKQKFNHICRSIAEQIAGKKLPQEQPMNGKYYHVIVARYPDKERADNLIAELKNDGYRPILRHHELID